MAEAKPRVRWMKALGITAVVLALLVVILVLARGLLGGLGGLHGPVRHFQSSEAKEEVSPLAAAEQTALTVTVVSVEPRSVETSVLATGTVVAWEDLPVSTEIAGLAITEVPVEEGDRVEEGQLLARLNDIQLRTQIEQQKASIAEAEATLEAARAELRRGQELAARNAISRQDLEARATAAKTAEARLGVARAGLSRLEAQRAQTRILAPADGYILEESAVIGQVVQTGAPLFRIVREGRLEVEAKVPEGDLFDIASGQPVRVTDPAGRAIEARVRTIAPLVDPRTRLGTVHVALPPDTGLKPGMFARVEIATDQAVALAVPQKAVIWRNGRNAVFTVQEGTASLRPVETGIESDGWIEIGEGLAPGDRVAVAGAAFLKDGDRVRVELAAAGQTAETAR
ncbi:efflux RND transporter periplasmic adaptor subunit [Chelativorans intermedius]|uniref:Efflux RND transporter periplasmic adaptor subunit n=1 Tax=Chelativorans intermedius TaxID=515947 RepID=A0ABV6DB03_9HYPH|nr:efflux RND transporter periplasmic adaptor subunit [Chelativorans intermedius]MCT9000158.1 efflux RND transporter periplasmic adaptor subunit [Chelativorans intermedius]